MQHALRLGSAARSSLTSFRLPSRTLAPLPRLAVPRQGVAPKAAQGCRTMDSRPRPSRPMRSVALLPWPGPLVLSIPFRIQGRLPYPSAPVQCAGDLCVTRLPCLATPRADPPLAALAKLPCLRRGEAALAGLTAALHASHRKSRPRPDIAAVPCDCWALPGCHDVAQQNIARLPSLSIATSDSPLRSTGMLPRRCGPEPKPPWHDCLGRTWECSTSLAVPPLGCR
jgi:hypothetical protein